MSWETIYLDSVILAADDQFSVVTEDIENSARPSIGEEARSGLLRLTISNPGGLSEVVLYQFGVQSSFLSSWEGGFEFRAEEWDLVLIDAGAGGTYGYTIDRWVETERVLCELTPPTAMMRLEEQVVANRQLPYAILGLLLEFTLRHLAGQSRMISIVDLVPDPVAGVGIGKFPVKPGARDITIWVLWAARTEAPTPLEGEFTLSIQLVIGAYDELREFVTPYNTTETALRYARWTEFVFHDVGESPGYLANTATGRITIASDDVAIEVVTYAVSILQHFTTVIEQDMSR